MPAETSFMPVLGKSTHKLLGTHDRVRFNDGRLGFIGVGVSAASTVLSVKLDSHDPPGIEGALDKLGRRRWKDVPHRQIERWDSPPGLIDLDMVEVGEAIAAVESVANAADALGADLPTDKAERGVLRSVFLDGTRLLATNGHSLRLAKMEVPGLAEMLGGGWLAVPWRFLLAWAEVWCSEEPQGVAVALDQTLTLVGTGLAPSVRPDASYSVQLDTSVARYAGLDFAALLAPIEEDVRPWTLHGRSADLRRALTANKHPVLIEVNGVRLPRHAMLSALPADPDAPACVRVTYPTEPAVIWVPDTHCGALVAPVIETPA